MHRLKLHPTPRLARSSRALHSKPFGYRPPSKFTLPDFTPEELSNRVTNASLLRLVESYRKHAHRAARVDPLGLADRSNVPALDPRRYGFELESDRVRDDFKSEVLPEATREQDKLNVTGILGFPDQGTSKTIDEIAQRLEEVYTGGVGYEFMHLPSKHERRFLETMLEQSHAVPIPTSQQLAQWKLLAASEGFDAWCAKRFPSVKRYGLQGGEGMMVALASLFEQAGKEGIEDVVIGMPHRGRLNLLTQLLDLDMRLLVRKMRGLPTLPPSLKSPEFSDDVLSHLFLSTNYSTTESDSLKVHLLPNPSHLETITPVGQGFARALQIPFGSAAKNDEELGDKVLNISLHGDSAFGGQGIVAETLNMASLPHFNVGGTVRIVVNNQLGYTTPAIQGRTSFYATDLAKSISAPVLHVNGDRIDDVARCLKLALAYQRKFRKDVIVDLVVYRRLGHNELDEPSFTSPIMYRRIKDLPSVASIYEKSLIDAGTLDAAEAASFRKEHFAKLDTSLVGAEPKNYTVPELEMPRGWSEMTWPERGEWEQTIDTGVRESVLREVGKRSVETPDEITVHPRLTKMHIAKRLQSVEKGEGIDFAGAEAMAFGTLLLDGYNVRLSGQDSGRGTFSQRHAIFADQNSEQTVVPLQTLATNPPASATDTSKIGTFEVVNSPLSEYAVVGFEQGVAWASPALLPIWEAQFGDFHNTAQVTLDTFFGSSETKWGMQSALTLLLPHGFDGAGPEHSSSRIERFLQLTNEPLRRQAFTPCLHAVNVTTPAQYFHLLRRQMLRPYRKPLVVFSPKGILRLPAASSSLSEMSEGTSFKPVLTEHVSNPSDVERVMFLSGKMYYDLVKQRSDRGLDGKIVFIRIEEISPFPYAAVEEALKPFESAQSIIWAQDEPENAGAFTFVLPRLQQVLPQGIELGYAGREAMATVAPGVKSYYEEQKKAIEDKIFEGL
ncbi:uncharacterized protein JCM15063_001407 [Sporobolomyces koalae]|uniref:uncharacterized protein n=1 Tax=Sporobolomyces koalae TaxID=500713 RepID=UPI00317B2E68